MANLPGVQFAPLTQNLQAAAKPGGLSPIQQAIQTLSLRIPRFAGPGISPPALLQGPGSGGLPPGLGGGPNGPLDLEEILRRIFGLPGAPPSTPPGTPPPVLPTPVIHPGGGVPPAGEPPPPITAPPGERPGYTPPEIVVQPPAEPSPPRTVVRPPFRGY